MIWFPWIVRGMRACSPGAQHIRDRLTYVITLITKIPMATSSKRNNDKIFQMRASEAFLNLVDDWRRLQTPLPSRAEAIRILVERAVREDRAARA